MPDLTQLEDMIWVHDRSEAIRFLKIKGSKVAIQVGFGGDYVYAVKSDFLEYLRNQMKLPQSDRFTDYDNEPEPVFVANGVLHIPIGVR